MTKTYEIELFNKKFFMLREENNSIGIIWKTLRETITNKRKSYAIAVNNEVLQDGKSIGWIKSQKEIE